MLSVPIDGQVQSRLIPPTFVEDNISDMFKAVDAGHNIVVTAVDEYGNRTSITTPDNVNHDMLGRSLEFASHPVLMRNVRRWMVWLLQAQYCKDYKWDTNRLGGWMEVLGLPADLDVPVTEEHLRVLKPVFNKDDADPYRLVARYDKQHYASCTLGTLIRLAEQTTPNYALNNPTRWCQTDRYRKLSIQPNPKENWDGMDRYVTVGADANGHTPHWNATIIRFDYYATNTGGEDYLKPSTIQYTRQEANTGWRKDKSAPTQQSSSTASR